MEAFRGSWLCPTEQDRSRALEAGGRVRIARTIAALACALTLIATAPWLGWGLLLLLSPVALVFLTLEARLRRAERPEWVAARSMLLVLAALALGAATTGGQDSPILPWLIFPCATAAARFRPQVVVVGAAITAATMIGVSLGVDAAAVLDDPSRLFTSVTLLCRGRRDHQRAHARRAGEPRPGRARPAHRPAQPRLARLAHRGDRAAGPAHRRLRGAGAARHRQLQARERRARARARRRRAARHRVRDPQVAALVRARLPDRRGGVPRAAARPGARRRGGDRRARAARRWSRPSRASCT